MLKVTCNSKGLISSKHILQWFSGQWTTVILMIIMEVLLGIKSKQGDVTAYFLHADLGKDEKVFVDMPRGFEAKGKNDKNKVLNLKKTIYVFC